MLNPTNDNYPDNMAYWQKTEVTKTHYGDDQNYTPLVTGNNFTNGSQEYLRSRVASVTIENIDDNNPTTYAHATHYSYDVHGNVKELIQENKNMPVTNQRLKKINYAYDLISGKVNEVIYQRNQPDMFMHRYEYDADNRITNVYTNKDNVIWDQDAKYFYYLHGPLARVEIGQHKVQSLDYAYTMQGWIKGINSNLLNADYDIGKDGVGALSNPSSGGTPDVVVNKYNARDAFAYSLTYFNNQTYKDYMAINTGVQNFISAEPTNSVTPDLYNGNIRQMVTSYLDASAPGKTYNLKSLLRNFTYDQLNRITSANSNDNLNTSTNAWGNVSISGIYGESFTYDQNGNILSLNRNGNLSGGAQVMDNLQYHYISNTNKLDYVTDLAGNNYTGDIKSGQTTGNYEYDAIGNLTKDIQENISNIKWTVYGKIKKITKSSGPVSEINFDYDASGNRISKNVVFSNGNINTIYYIRDAQGNTMATYENNIVPSTSNTYSLTEQYIYGSSRLGMINNTIDPSVVLSNGNYFTRNVDRKTYELSNHLGNIISTVNAKKIAVENTNDNVVDYFSSEVLSATDYYAFGQSMPGRSYFSSDPYRYGMNGQENDDEITGNHGTHTSAEYWEYDTRLGRRWNVDPVVKPWRSGYDAFGNSPIWKVDPNGDDDYYNKKGEYIGSHGENNGIMRVVASKAVYDNVVKTNTHAGKEIVVDPSAGNAVKQAASNSYGSGKEWVAIITFDPEKAIISGEVFEQGSNYSPIESSAPTKEEYEQKNPNKILLATSHGHPKEQRDGWDNSPGPSPGDIKSVEQTKVPEYQVDAYKIEHVEATNTGGTGNITVVNKDKTVTPNVGTVGKIGTSTGKFNIGKDALERSGGKPKK